MCATTAQAQHAGARGPSTDCRRNGETVIAPNSENKQFAHLNIRVENNFNASKKNYLHASKAKN